jgi:hypothetical protein
MTKGIPVQDRRILGALKQAPADARDGARGGWHPTVIAARVDWGGNATRAALERLRAEGRVVRVQGLGPAGARPSYLPADHPDAEGGDA